MPDPLIPVLAPEAALDEQLHRERRAIALFEAALPLPPTDRATLIAAEAGADEALRQRVAAMLSAHERAGLRTGAATADLEAEAPPERIGGYRIEGLIGRGGMGSVYRASREAADFEHVVAIKVIKPGLLSKSLVERFQAERRMLAGLIHANIARLYDGGEIEAGSPYFVMELVDGRPLMQWADGAGTDGAGGDGAGTDGAGDNHTGATKPERTRLFLEICDAVAFAHRRLIVHRDLTPSNVLVTADGTAKLIDFGIARLAEEPDALRLQPSIASLSLTPGYAAPERLTGAPVSTSSDIYSLGKILARLMADEADRELAAIVAMATEPQAADRYPTVEALAADIRAWRDGFPVSPLAGERRYRAAKFLRRHAAGVTAGTLALALLTGALVYALVADSRAQAARIEAETRFEDLRSLAGYVLFDLNDQLARVPGNTAARASLADRAQRYLDQLAASPGASAELRLETARGLIALAEIQGMPLGPNLGERDQAVANLEAAEALLAARGADDAPAAAARARAIIFRSLIALQGEGDQTSAEALLGQGEQRLRAVPAPRRERAWLAAQRTLRLAQLEFADSANQRERMPALVAAALADRRAWPQALRTSFAARADDANFEYYRGLAAAGDDPAAALALHLRAEQAFDALLQERRDDPNVLYRASWNLVDGFAVASQLGDDTRSRRLIGRAEATIDRLAEIDSSDNSVRSLRSNIKEAASQSLRDVGRFDEAIAAQRQVVTLRAADEREAGIKWGGLGFAQMILGVIARDAGQRALACSSWQDAQTSMAKAVATGDIISFHEGFIPGINAHVTACAQGTSIAAPLR